jgi:hypothetical protein
MSKIPLNLKGFKHASSTNDSTTLVHPAGHTITLAHKPLSPENRAQLKALAGAAKSAQTPMQAQEARSQMKDGGKVKGPNNPKLAESIKEIQAKTPAVPGAMTPAAGYQNATPMADGGILSNVDEVANANEEARRRADAARYGDTGGTLQSPSGADEAFNEHIKQNEASVASAGGGNQDAEAQGYTHLAGNAEGGEVKKQPENKLDYSQFKQKPLPKGPSQTLNYKDIKQQYREKNRKMYAEGTPDGTIPTNLDPNSENSEAPPVAAPNQTPEPSMEQRMGEAIGHAARVAFAPVAAAKSVYDKASQGAADAVKAAPPHIATFLQGAGKGLGLRETTDEDVANQPSQQQQSQDQTKQPADTTQAAPSAAAPAATPDANAAAAPAPDPTAAPPATPPAQAPMPATYSGIKQSAMNELGTEHKNFEQDLIDGHITPKTYNSLFADMKTPERIGTLFGMLLSGAGSGLSHQPNAVFAMMNQQIANDLTAQQDSKTNAMNYLKTNQQALLAQSQSKNLDQATKIQAYNLAKMQMNSAALHGLVMKVQALPPGSPERAAAEQQLAALNSSVQQDNFNLQDRAASASAYYKMMGVGSQSASQDPESAFKQQTNFLRMQGGVGEQKARDMEAKHVPGYADAADREIPEDIRARINAHDVLANKAQDLQKYIQDNRLTMSPSKRAVAEQKAEELKNFYSSSVDSGVMTQGRMAWLDKQISTNPTGVAASLLGNDARIKEIADSNNARKNTLLQNIGINPLRKTSGGGAATGAPQQAQSQIAEGTTGKSNGRPVIFTNGKWQYR